MIDSLIELEENKLANHIIQNSKPTVIFLCDSDHLNTTILETMLIRIKRIYHDYIDIVKILTSQNSPSIDKFEISEFPTIVLITDTFHFSTIEGNISERDLRKEIDKFLLKYYERKLF
jgi:thioredoxin-like negative regulator of GroEL